MNIHSQRPSHSSFNARSSENTPGKRGRAINPCHVLLVATNTNEVKATPSQHRSNMNSLHFDAVTMFSRDFSIYPKIIGVDSSQPMSADMKVLKGVLLEMKNGILQVLEVLSEFLVSVYSKGSAA